MIFATEKLMLATEASLKVILATEKDTTTLKVIAASTKKDIGH